MAGLITELRRPDGLPGTDRHGRFTSPSDVLLRDALRERAADVHLHPQPA